jgi:hypothetical protein
MRQPTQAWCQRNGKTNPGAAAANGYNTGFDAGIGAGGGAGALGDLAAGALTDGAGSLVTSGAGSFGYMADALSGAGLDVEATVASFDGAMIGADLSLWGQLNKKSCGGE